MAQETRNAYGEKLAELIQKNENIVVLDADLTKSTKTAEERRYVLKDISMRVLPKPT